MRRSAEEPPRAAPESRLSAASFTASAGYTALELLISMLLVGLLLAGLYAVLFQTQASFEAQEDAMNLRQEARVILNELTIELRVAGYDIGNLPEIIVDAAVDRLSFVADIDDGDAEAPCGAATEAAVNGGAERVTYRHQSGLLLRTIDCWDGSAWANEYTDAVVARNLLATNPLFRYFDAADVELVPVGTLTTAQRAVVRSIALNIEMEDPELQVLGRPHATFAIGTHVLLRNAGQ